MKSIKTKLTVSITAIIAGAVAIIVIIAMIALNILNSTSFESFMRPLADQCANTVSTYVGEKTREVTTTVNSPDILYAETSVNVISYFYNNEKNFSCLDYGYFEADGTYVVSNSNRSTKYAANSIFTKVKGTKAAAVSSPIFDQTGEMYYLIGAPLLDSEGAVVGILIMSYDYSAINDIVNNIQIGESGFAYLMGSSGTYITDKDPENIKAQKNPIVLAKTDSSLEYASQLHQYILKEKSGMTSYEFNDETYASGFSPIDEMNAYVVIYAPEKSFFDITTFMLICIAIGLAITGGAFIFVRHLSKKIANPIIKTTERLRSLSEGNLSDPVSVINTKDELNLLSTSLNDTVVTLKKYVDVIASSLVNIADGNLTDRVHGSFKGDFIKIKSTFNTIIESLIDTFTNINSAAEEVNSGAGQVSDGSQALSQGATEQASAIEELSTTISDISEHITTSAKSAKKAAEIASESVLSIDSCNKDMTKMLSAMDEIDASSSEISKIIKVIDDIAFQTNILALNAAVEAARAGSAGKGFAVVADEVRNLAAKSAQAAKQTTSLIGSSIQSVGNGSVIAKQTAKALIHVVEQTEEINELIQAISESTEIQA
ncbi:MAG: methyl-accepting chemotaxis protein, partial [Oscillospiraceae bacterium]